MNIKELLTSVFGYSLVAVATLFILFVVEPYLFTSGNAILIGLGIFFLVMLILSGFFVVLELIKRNKNK